MEQMGHELVAICDVGTASFTIYTAALALLFPFHHITVKFLLETVSSVPTLENYRDKNDFTQILTIQVSDLVNMNLRVFL